MVYTLGGMNPARRTAVAALMLSVLGLGAGCSSDPAAGGTVEKVSPKEAVTLIQDGEHTVIDVRTQPEFAAGHVDGAQNIDVSSPDFESLVGELPKDEEYLVYCQSGNRSATASSTMAELGFTDVVDGGGVVDLEAAGADIVAGG